MQNYWTVQRSTRAPKHVIVIDTESVTRRDAQDESITRCYWRMGCGRYYKWSGQEYRLADSAAYDDLDKMWEWLSMHFSKREETWVISHNISWDLTQLRFWELLDNRTFRMLRPVKVDGRPDDYWEPPDAQRGKMILGDPPVAITVFTADGRKVIFADSFNWFRTSVQKLGESVGLPKLPMPGDECDFGHWSDYCLRDVDIVARAFIGLLTWWREEQLGVFATTIGACAANAYKRRFMSTAPTPDNNHVSRVLARWCFYGGKVECRRYGRVYDFDEYAIRLAKHWNGDGLPVSTGGCHYWDIVSAYAYVMADNVYPGKRVLNHVNPSLDLLGWMYANYCVLALVLIESPLDTYPVRYKGETVWAVGKYWTALCGPDLQRAIRNRHVKECVIAFGYERVLLFKDYVDYFFSIKRGSAIMQDHCKEHLAKLFLVSLFGKIGQMAERWKDRPDLIPPVSWGHWNYWNQKSGTMIQCRSIAGNAQQYVGRAEVDSSCPLIGSFVTAYLREVIDMWCSAAGNENVLYVDTDGIHVNDTGHARLLDSAINDPYVLGSLVHKGSAREVWYRGIRDYDWDGVPSIAGLPSHAEKKWGRVYAIKEFDRLSTIIDRGGKPYTEIHDATMVLPECNVRGRIHDDGRVDPLRIIAPGIPDDLGRLLWGNGWCDNPLLSTSAVEAVVGARPEDMSEYDSDSEGNDGVSLGQIIQDLAESSTPLASDGNEGINKDGKGNDSTESEDDDGSHS